MKRLIMPALVTLLLVGVLVVGVFPTRSYLAQRRAVSSADAKLAQLSSTNDTMQAQIDRLGTDAEIEKQAREAYGLVKKGEEPYRILPPAQDPLKVPDVWPFNRLKQRLDR